MQPWRARLERRLIQEPLFETRVSLAGLRRYTRGEPPRTILLGIGLCSRDALSSAVPLDLLGMLLPAEILRRQVGACELLVLVADAHALENGFSPEAVRARTRAVIDALAAIRCHCRLERLRIVRASELELEPAYRATLEEVSRCAGQRWPSYLLRQFTDALHLHRRAGPLIKVGWALAGPEGTMQRDEVALDALLCEVTCAPLGFAYCKAARSLADAAPRVPPYVVRRPQARLCLDPEEDPVHKVAAAARVASPMTVSAFRNHLRRLVYTYGRVVESLPHLPLEERVAVLIGRLAGARGAWPPGRARSAPRSR